MMENEKAIFLIFPHYFRIPFARADASLSCILQKSIASPNLVRNCKFIFGHIIQLALLYDYENSQQDVLYGLTIKNVPTPDYPVDSTSNLWVTLLIGSSAEKIQYMSVNGFTN